MKLDDLLELPNWRLYLIFFLFIVGMIFIYVGGEQFLKFVVYLDSLKKISQPSVCTMDGTSVKKQDASSLFIIPKDMGRVYICGNFDTPIPELLTVHLYKSGADRAFYSTTSLKALKTGPFIFDIISTDHLKPGEYRADIHVIRDKPAAVVHFIIQ